MNKYSTKINFQNDALTKKKNRLQCLDVEISDCRNNLTMLKGNHFKYTYMISEDILETIKNCGLASILPAIISFGLINFQYKTKADEITSAQREYTASVVENLKTEHDLSFSTNPEALPTQIKEYADTLTSTTDITYWYDYANQISINLQAITNEIINYDLFFNAWVGITATICFTVIGVSILVRAKNKIFYEKTKSSEIQKFSKKLRELEQERAILVQQINQLENNADMNI